VLIRPIRITMAAMKAVEVAGLVRRMHRHAGEPRLLEIEDARARELLKEGQRSYLPDQ